MGGAVTVQPTVCCQAPSKQVRAVLPTGCCRRCSVLEDHSPAGGRDQHAVAQVPAHSAGQHEALQVPPLAHHVLHAVAVCDTRDVLQDGQRQAWHINAAATQWNNIRSATQVSNSNSLVLPIAGPGNRHLEQVLKSCTSASRLHIVLAQALPSPVCCLHSSAARTCSMMGPASSSLVA